MIVVDDDPDVVCTIKSGLSDLTDRYEIIGAESGEECITLLKEGLMPDLIILDIMMPGMDGWETHKMLKENEQWGNIPIVFLTALDDEKTIKKGMETNSYCIKKPFDVKELKERIDFILEEDRLF